MGRKLRLSEEDEERLGSILDRFAEGMLPEHEKLGYSVILDHYGPCHVWPSGCVMPDGKEGKFCF